MFSLSVGLLLIAAIGQPASAATSAFERGQHYYAQQNWRAALESFLQAVNSSNEPTEQLSAHFYAAESALQLKDYSRAIAEYGKISESTAAGDLQGRARFRLAECSFLIGDLPTALAGFQQFVADIASDDLIGEAHNYMGEISLELRRYEAALESFAHVIETSDGKQTDRARLGMARALLALGRFDEVPVTLGRLCQGPDANIASEGLLILGRSKYERQQYNEALATFRRVYLLQADRRLDDRAHLAAGWALWKLSRFGEVASEVSGIEKSSESRIELHFLRGMTAYAMRDWHLAIDELLLATKNESPHKTAAMFYCGESALLGGNPKQARTLFQQLLDTEPDSSWSDDAMWGLARAAKASDDEAGFNAACEILRSKYPASDFAAQVRSLATAADGPLEEALAVPAIFEEASELERDGFYSGAIAAYCAFIKLDQESGLRTEALWRIARLHDRLKQYVEARKAYNDLLSEYPAFDRAVEVISNLARIESEAGDLAAAAGHYRNLVEKFPQSEQALEACYWLALAAADENQCKEAQWQVDWLLQRSDPASRTLSDTEQRIRLQTLCLGCQLWAGEDKWQTLADTLDNSHELTGESNLTARLEFWRAEAALRLGKIAEARRRFDALMPRVVGINEAWEPMVSLRRAQLAARSEDWQQVLALVDEIEHCCPEFELAYECDYLKGRALAGRGEMSAARASYSCVLENDWAAGTETAAMAQWMIGETFFHQKDYEQATQAYNRVIERHHFPEWQARSALQAGKCAELNDHWDNATKCYADALTRWGETKSGRELQARLKWVEQQVALREVTLRR